MFFLFINDAGQLALDIDGTVTRIHSLFQLNELTGGAEVACSSTVDFPRESTSDKAVLKLCRDIRAGKSPKVEAYGVSGMQSKAWHRVFASNDAFARWADSDAAGNVTVYGTRFIEG